MCRTVNQCAEIMTMSDTVKLMLYDVGFNTILLLSRLVISIKALRKKIDKFLTLLLFNCIGHC